MRVGINAIMTKENLDAEILKLGADAEVYGYERPVKSVAQIEREIDEALAHKP